MAATASSRSAPAARLNPSNSRIVPVPTTSQEKRIRTNEKRRVRNQAVKSELKTLVRKTREAVDAGDAEAAEAALKVASRKLDKAASKGVIHKNQAANRKSAIASKAAAL